MNEAYLKKRFKEALRTVMPGCVVIRHEDKFSAGIPDLSVAWNGTVSWIEVKYSRAGRLSRPTALQAEALKQLAANSVPAYLLTYRDAVKVKTPGGEVELGKAVTLDRANSDGTATTVYVSYGAGFDHTGIAAAIRTDHESRGGK